MPTLKDLENNDEVNNPSAQAARELVSREKTSGATQSGNNNPGSSDTSDGAAKNINDVRTKEETPDQGLYRPGGKGERGKTVNLKAILKKRGPVAALVTLGLGLPTLFTIFLSPALLLQQFSETLTGKFNDQLAALDVRSTALLKKKYNSTLTKGQCGTKITIRCKYQTIREGSGMAKRLKAAGVEIKGDRSLIPGRIKPTSFVFQGQSIAAKDLLREARTNPALRSALRKGYDPLYAGFSDKVATKVRTALGLKRSSNVNSSTDSDKMNEDLKDTAAGTNDIPEDGLKLTEEKDEDGKTTGYTDADGNRYGVDEGRRLNNLIDEGFNRDELAKKVSKTAVKSSLKGALTVTAMGAGAVDSLCTAWVMIRVAGFAAKVYQQRQLIRYAYEFQKVAHKQKSGDLTQEEMAFFGEKLTQVNSEGKAALDSDGYKFAAYGDLFAPASFDPSASKKDSDLDAAADKAMLQNETSRYVNGQLLNDNMMSKMIGAITGGSSKTVDAADSVCKFTKSWKGQALVFGLAAAGLVVAFFSGGASVGAGAVIQGAASVAISVALALIQPKLIDMAKGEVIKGDENGNETGNAVVSGLGGYNSQTAQGRGLQVATQSAYTAYLQTSNEIAARYAEEDRNSRSPFDPGSPNTFLGSVVASILPYSTKMQTAGSSSLAIASMVGTTFSSLGTAKKVSAAAESEQFTKCDDSEYKDLAADPFCNLRYMLPGMETDPGSVLDYMVSGGYVTEEDPTPLGEYAEYVEKCIDRKTSIGDPFNEDGGSGDAGDDCIVGKGGDNEKRNMMFALFYVDTSVDEGMEEDYGSEIAGTQASGGGAEINIASFNVRGASHDGDNGTINYVTRMAKTVETIQREGFDVIGFQEFETKQRKEFNKSAVASTYKLSNNDAGEDNGNAIAWNTSKYELLDQGTQPDLVYTTGGKLKAPWVKLQDKATSQTFYVLNTHDPANVHDNPVTKNAARRTANAKEHVTFMKERAAEGIPVFSTGDFNSSFDKRSGDVNVTASNIKETLPYCIMTADGSIQNAFDMYKSRQVKCPNNDINWSKEDPGKGCSTQIDHLYIASAGIPITVTDFGCVKKGDKQGTVQDGNGADHDTVKFVVSVGGGTSGSDNLGDNYGTPSYAINPAVQVDEPGSRCTGGFTPGAQSLSKIIKGRWSIIKTIGGYACRANTADPSSLSVHAVGRALDIMVDANTPAGLKAGDEIRNFLINNAEVLGVQRVIWNRHIWSANVAGWRNYTGPDPHTSHVHAEINLKASRNANLGG